MNGSQTPRSLKILQVCTSASWGGMELHVGVLSDLLAKDGLAVRAICATGSKLEKFLRKANIPCEHIAEGGYFRPLAIFKAIRVLKTYRPDVVHVHYSKDLWWLIPAVALSGQRAVILSKHVGTQKPKTDFLHRWLYERVQFIIAISAVIQQNIIRTHPISADRVVVVHHGVDMQRFNPQAVDRWHIREALGFSREQFVLGIIGRLQLAKGYLEFLQMAHALKHRYPHCRYLWVGEASRGEGEEAQKILRRIDELGLQKWVKWVGYREDIPEMLAAMDLFVFPSHAEAFGLVLIEAMAMGKPVISSNCDGVLDIVVPQRTGLLVPPRQPEELTRAAIRLIESPELRKAMGEAGRKRVETHFNQTLMLKKMKELYANARMELN